MGVFQKPLTLILLQKYRDTNGRRIAIQIGGAYTTFCQEEGILLQKYRHRNGRCIAILFKSVGVRGRCDSLETLSVTSGTSQRKSRDIPPKFFGFLWALKDIPNPWAPAPSRGRPPPHRKMSGRKRLSPCSFLFRGRCDFP